VSERTAKYFAYGFATVSALLVPVTSFINMAPLNSTVFAGGTLVMVYLASNPRLLVADRVEQREVVRAGLAIPLALYLGTLLMIIGVLEAVARSRAT
jgi:hypothetical protein